MKLLVDTHVFIWATADPGRVRPGVRAALAASENVVFVSAVSAWEIAIKRTLGRLDFPLEELDAILARAGFDPLAITPAHGVEAGGLPRHHGDPFDRMLVAQARVEGLALVSDDAAIAAYDVQRFSVS